MLMYCKLLCKKSIFVINYNYLSVKYDLCKRDWYCHGAHLKCAHKLCDLRDGNINGGILYIGEINPLIQTICLD